jgi:hypothetical protein
MSRNVLIPLFAATFLVVPAIEQALAVTNLNSSRSNIYRQKAAPGPKQPGAARATTVKSSKSNTSSRMGGGKGSSSRTTTVKSSKSNTSDRMGGGGFGGGILNPQPPTKSR